ncbi:MAG TPA: MFS transporter [Candidatus Agrococcus pullicola]|uniref:MFS transporter n=1 Tax=Candidatus Agrococcus pullicola TaxID=2838429 RepID=A0A9D1YST5_9MICO|nr:MFS transporter [Candidatus Agrococcus pullicola]
MIAVLRNRSYATLFSAQVIALLGTGLLTVALGLLAFDIAGGDAGFVLGTALTIKMVAYVGISPVMAALTAGLSRKVVLVAADAVRAGIAFALPWVTDTWHIYVLIFVLQAASATFTPAFQAVIPSILPDERDYTRALSLSRMAYDLESLLSPAFAAALLTVMSYSELFVGTALGFCVSLALVAVTRFPPIRVSEHTSFLRRLTDGMRVYLGAAQLRSLLAMNIAVAAVTAMVIVNSVVLVRHDLGRGERDVALLLAAYGAGSMVVALLMPRLLDRVQDRPVMLSGAVLMPIGLLLAAGAMTVFEGDARWLLLLLVWVFLGGAVSLVLTPSARLLRRATDPAHHQAVFAAQFSLSHACFMLAYPLAGMLGARAGLPFAALILAGTACAGSALAFVFWQKRARVRGNVAK